MREIKREIKDIDGRNVVVYSTDIANHNILEVAAGSTGDFPGADKYDVKTYIRIKDQGGTNWKATASVDEFKKLTSIEFELKGYAELETMIEGLTFIREALLDAKEGSNERYCCKH